MKVSDFGYDPVDSTQFLQAALDSAADVVIIDKVAAGDWITRPLFITRSNMTVLVELGVLVRALAGGFPGTSDSLLTIDAQSAITLSGYGAVFAMNKAEYTSGEWRHILRIRGVADLTVEGLTLQDSGGDGIYLGASPSLPPGDDYCQNIVIRNVISDNNRRNALSVISVDGLTVEHSAFTRTSGTSPQAGVDFEPNAPHQRLRNIVMQDCRMDYNGTYALVMSLGNLDGTSEPVDMLLDRIRVGPTSSQNPNFTFYGCGDSDPGGQIIIKDSLLNKGPESGLLSVFRKSSDGMELTFKDTVLWDYGEPQRWQPITVSAIRNVNWPPVTGEYGGVTWDHCGLMTNTEGDFLVADSEPAGSPGISDLHGKMWVTNPNGVTMDLGSSPDNITLDIVEVTSADGVPVSISSDRSNVQRGETAYVTISRPSTNVDAPLAIQYTTANSTAVERLDFEGLSREAVIRPGETSVEVPIHTRTIPDADESRVVVVGMVGGRGYSPTMPHEVSISITD